jgi:hypothetical protein
MSGQKSKDGGDSPVPSGFTIEGDVDANGLV